MKWCNTCNMHRMRKTSTEVYMFRGAKKRAKSSGIPFSLEIEDIVIPETCPVFGFPLVKNLGGNGPSNLSPSLDRIIPELGYVKGNVQVISYLANKMKSNATQEQLSLFAKWINNTLIKNQEEDSGTV